MTTVLSRLTIEKAYEKFQSSLSPEIMTQMNGRLERGFAIALNKGVTCVLDENNPNSTHLYRVTSSGLHKLPYIVDLQARSCSCPDRKKAPYCQHIVAAQIIKIANQIHKQQFEALDNNPHLKPAVKTPPAPPVTDSRTMPDLVIWGVVRLNGKPVVAT